MLTIKPRTSVSLLSITLLSLLLAAYSRAEVSPVEHFLEVYISNYEKQQFPAQVILVQNNAGLVPIAIRKLAKEAMQEGRPQEEKMYLLKVASSLAYMHKNWHNDDAPLREIEPLIKREVGAAKKKVLEVKKWKAEERIIGTFAMMTQRSAMLEQGLAPVLYPHWMHRIFFECKVCHSAIFKMKRHANGITQEKIAAGEQCGKCHDGTLAFSATDEKACKRCHLAATPAAKRLHNPTEIDLNWLAERAKHVGSKWSTENLKDGKIPVDKFSFIDWLELKKRKVFAPRISLDENYVEETKDNQIMFMTKADSVDDVLFDHKVHSDWITCDTCHPDIFVEELGANDVTMPNISAGKFCGHCHGKVSFTFADCLRCHKIPKGKPVATALIRERHP